MVKSLCFGLVVLGFEFWVTSFLGVSYFYSSGLSLNSSVCFIGILWGLNELICAKHIKLCLEAKSSIHLAINITIVCYDICMA